MTGTRKKVLTAAVVAVGLASIAVPAALSQNPVSAAPDGMGPQLEGLPAVARASDFSPQVKAKVARLRGAADIKVKLPDDVVKATGANGGKGQALNSKKIAFPANGQVCVADVVSGAGECVVDSAVGRAFAVAACDYSSYGGPGEVNVQGIVADGVRHVEIVTADGKRTRVLIPGGGNYLDVNVKGQPVRVEQSNGQAAKLPPVEVPDTCGGQ
jgi:hypothetical protein